MITKAEAIAYLLPRPCASCGARLSGPGEPCDACGRIPEVTAPEAAQYLGSATALAAVEGSVLETQAEALYQAAMAKWQEAAQVVHVARLRDHRDAAQKAYDEHQAKHRLKVAARTRAEKAEDAAAAELEPEAAAVVELAAAVGLARKMRHGVKAVAEAVALHTAAAGELKSFQDDLARATAKRKQAATEVTASEARRDQLKKAKDDAEDALADPGIAPLGKAAIVTSPFRVLREGKLDAHGPGLEIAADAGRAICDLTGSRRRSSPTRAASCWKSRSRSRRASRCT